MNRSTRSRSVRWLVAGVVPILAVLGFATVGGTFAGSDDPGMLALDEVRTFEGYAVYNAGDSTADEPLVAVRQRDDSAAFVSFIYGKCENVNGNACSPPAEVQTWPACRRHLGLYKGPYAPEPEHTTIRGVPAAFFEGGSRLEIQTGRSTIVVFARNRAEAIGIAEDLEGVNLGVPSGTDLPPPAAGALIGGVACGF